MLRALNILPNFWAYRHSIQIGNLLVIMTLTLGLVYWFKHHYDERQALHLRVIEKDFELSSEKDRIARDLHDNIGSQLSLVSMDLATLSKENRADASRFKLLQESMSTLLLS